MSSSGTVYVLENPAFPGLVKIGYAKDLGKRIRQLNRSSAVPYSFRVAARYEIPERLSDRDVHSIIDTLDPSLRTTEIQDGRKRTREFFRISPEKAIGILRAVARISGTLDRLEVFGKADSDGNVRKGTSFSFSALGIGPGERIEFRKDPRKKATVADDLHVAYGNEVLTLSALASRLLGRKASGPRHFSYKGRRLTDLDRRSTI